jgi:hypothetical protein
MWDPEWPRLLNHQPVGRTNLSEREKGVLVPGFRTESKDLVGKRLSIAPTTVRTHLQRARAKYATVGRPAPTKSALLARAVEDGISAWQTSNRGRSLDAARDCTFRLAGHRLAARRIGAVSRCGTGVSEQGTNSVRQPTCVRRRG